MANRRDTIPGYLYALDGLRALALLMIWLFHSWQQSWVFLYVKLSDGSMLNTVHMIQRYGYVAIDIFFVLSGFCLFYPIARTMFGEGKEICWKEFYIKRAKRILPSYILILLVMAFVPDLATNNTYSLSEFVKQFFSSLFFVQNCYAATHGTLVSTAWTLAIEVQFYLVFPLIAKVFRKKPWLTLLSSLVLCEGLRLYAISNYVATNTLQGHMIFYIDIFVIGMMCAYLFVLAKHKLPYIQKLKKPMTFASILCMLLAYYFMCWMGGFQSNEISSADAVHRFMYRPILDFAVAGFIFTTCFSIDAWEKGIWGNRVAMFLSTISYNFYLWHQNIHIYFKRNPVELLYTAADVESHAHDPMVKYMVFTGLVSLAIAILVTYLIEIPIYKYGPIGYVKRIGQMFKKKEEV